MDAIAGLPFVKVKFDKDGDRVEQGKPLHPADVRNLIVIAHGWKNDEAAADRLYSELVRNMRDAAGGQALVDDGFGVTGIYWPAFVFKPDLTILEADVPASQGGGASAGGGGDLAPGDLDAFAAEVAAFIGVADPVSFREQAREATGGGGAADALADRLRLEVPADGADADTLFEQEGRERQGHRLFDFLKQKPGLPGGGSQGGGGAAGGASGGVGATFSRLRFLAGPQAAVARMLNQFTYFEMKKRAGIVGAALARQLDDDGLDSIGLHLVGHSFGARLVTSTASRLTRVRPRSLTLLQAAYSHNGLGIGKGKVPKGAFRDVVDAKRVSGPIVITHTRNDTAVGVAYVVASRASGVTAAAFGGPDDPYGGMGANGAQLVKPGEAVSSVLTGAGTPVLASGVITNVLADDPIKEHNDVSNKVVARLVLAAVRA